VEVAPTRTRPGVLHRPRRQRAGARITLPKVRMSVDPDTVSHRGRFGRGAK
jgi:hypothetical protein